MVTEAATTTVVCSERGIAIRSRKTTRTRLCQCVCRRGASSSRLGDEIVYSKLNKLLHQGELKRFVDARSEFSWQPKGQKGMLITWGAGAAPSSASAPASTEPAERASASGSASASGNAPVVVIVIMMIIINIISCITGKFAYP